MCSQFSSSSEYNYNLGGAGYTNYSRVHFYSDGAREVHLFTQFLLRNGLSFFYGVPLWRGGADRMFQWKGLVSWYAFAWLSISLLRLLFIKLLECSSYVPFVGGVAQQLLALGYGRRELHPLPLALFDENLHDMRCKLVLTPISQSELLLKSLVEQFIYLFIYLQSLCTTIVSRHSQKDKGLGIMQ